MRVAVASDHAGYRLKQAVVQLLGVLGVPCEDLGPPDDASVDYPDFAARVARAVASGTHDRGILVCGTGIGMTIAANKVAAVRCAPAWDLDSARLAREHNDANVLALGARLTPAALALEIVRVFLDTPFAGGRHQLRVDKITALERNSRQDSRQSSVDSRQS